MALPDFTEIQDVDVGLLTPQTEEPDGDLFGDLMFAMEEYQRFEKMSKEEQAKEAQAKLKNKRESEIHNMKLEKHQMEKEKGIREESDFIRKATENMKKDVEEKQEKEKAKTAKQVASSRKERKKKVYNEGKTQEEIHDTKLARQKAINTLQRDMSEEQIQSGEALNNSEIKLYDEKIKRLESKLKGIQGDLSETDDTIPLSQSEDISKANFEETQEFTEKPESYKSIFKRHSQELDDMGFKPSDSTSIAKDFAENQPAQESKNYQFDYEKSLEKLNEEPDVFLDLIESSGVSIREDLKDKIINNPGSLTEKEKMGLATQYAISQEVERGGIKRKMFDDPEGEMIKRDSKRKKILQDTMNKQQEDKTNSQREKSQNLFNYADENEQKAILKIESQLKGSDKNKYKQALSSLEKALEKSMITNSPYGFDLGLGKDDLIKDQSEFNKAIKLLDGVENKNAIMAIMKVINKIKEQNSN